MKGKHTTRNCSQFLGQVTTVQTVVGKNLFGRIAGSVETPALVGLFLERICTLLFVSAVQHGGICILPFVLFGAEFVRNELTTLYNRGSVGSTLKVASLF